MKVFVTVGTTKFNALMKAICSIDVQEALKEILLFDRSDRKHYKTLFLDAWYENHQSDLQSGELEKFKNKIEGVRKEWPFRVSHLVLLGMRRQSKPDKR